MRAHDEAPQRPETEPAATLDPRTGPRVAQLRRPAELRALKAGATVMTAGLVAAGVLVFVAPAVLLLVQALSGADTSGPVTPALVSLAVAVGLVGVTALLVAVCSSFANAARTTAALASARRDREAVPGAMDRHRLRDDAATPMIVAAALVVPIGAIALVATGIALFEELAREEVTRGLVELVVLALGVIALGVWCFLAAQRLERRRRSDHALLVSLQGPSDVERACRRERAQARSVQHADGVERPSDEALDAALKRPHPIERNARHVAAIGVALIGAGATAAIVAPNTLVRALGLCAVALGFATLGLSYRLALRGGVHADRERAVLRARWWPGDAEIEPLPSSE